MHQLDRTRHPEDSDPFGERRADLRMEERGEVLSLQAGELRGGVEGDRRRYVGGDELEYRQEPGVVREGFVMHVLREAGDLDQCTHDGVDVRQQGVLPQRVRRPPRLVVWVAGRAPARAPIVTSRVNAT